MWVRIRLREVRGRGGELAWRPPTLGGSLQEQSSSKCNEARAVAGMERGAGGRRGWGRRKVGGVRDEELNDAIDLDIERVRRPTCRTDCSGRSFAYWTPGDYLWKTGRPCCTGARCSSPRKWSSQTGHTTRGVFSDGESSSGAAATEGKRG